MLIRVIVMLALQLVASPVCRAQSPADSGRIVGAIRDSATGRPVVGADVRSELAFGRTATDARGHFSVSHVAAQVQLFEVHCPSTTLLGRLLLAKRIRVKPRDSTVINVRVDAAVCDEPAYREVTGELRGFWSSGFEHNAFSVCADSGLRIPRRPAREGDDDGWSEIVAWVTFTDQGLADLRRLEGSALGDSVRAATKRGEGMGVPYVRWYGTLKGPGVFGHMGGSDYGVTVDRVAYIGTGDSRVCRQPPDSVR